MFRLKEIRAAGVLAVDELAIPEGRVVCMTGESGSGKTTLLKLLNGMIPYDSGEIYVRGEPLSAIDLVALRRRVIMSPQNAVLFGSTVRDNLQAGLGFSGRSPASAEALREALETVCLRKEPDDRTDTLSGGEKQRLALARVLLMEPEVWLMDEPTSALDERTSLEVMARLVRRMKAGGRTIVMVTHSPSVVRSFAEFLIEVRAGRVVRAEEVKS